MNERLDFKWRENNGKKKIKSYKETFIRADFDNSNLKPIDLIGSDLIIDEVKKIFPGITARKELLNEDLNFVESDLMREIYLSLKESELSYIYTDDFIYCGMFLVDSKKAFENAFNVAKVDIQQTCFILDSKFRFHFTITYNDKLHSDFPNAFDIQRKSLLS